MIVEISSQTQLELVVPAKGLTMTDPPSNTGSDSQNLGFRGLEIGVDALTLLWSGDLPVLEHIRLLMEVTFDYTKAHERRIGILWNRCYVGTLGCLYSQRDTAEGVSHRVAISGTALARVPQALIHRFIQICCQYPDLRCSRIDLRVDDYAKQLNLDDIYQALAAGDYAGFKYGSTIVNHGIEGWTCYLGSRDSEQYIRIYDKDAESGGKIPSVRYESEFKGGKASQIFRCIGGDDSFSASTLSRWVLGSVQFITRTDKNIDRCNPLEWWSDFVHRVTTEVCVAIIARVASSVERKKDWVSRQVSRSLALMERAFGTEGFASALSMWLADGREKLRKIDELMLIEYLVCQNSVT